MLFRECEHTEQRAVVELFTSVFSESEGLEEGELVGRLASELFDSSGESDLFSFVAETEGRIVGAIVFSRMIFENENAVFILAPVAVHPECQGKGIGQRLIRHGLEEMQLRGARFALTYGDPKFYGKVGFQAVSPEQVRPPFELSQPEGWLGQSLCDHPVDSLLGKSSCVEALRNPVYW